MSFPSMKLLVFQPGYGGILQFHQALDVAQTFEGGERFSVRGLKSRSS